MDYSFGAVFLSSTDRLIVCVDREYLVYKVDGMRFAPLQEHFLGSVPVFLQPALSFMEDYFVSPLVYQELSSSELKVLKALRKNAVSFYVGVGNYVHSLRLEDSEAAFINAYISLLEQVKAKDLGDRISVSLKDFNTVIKKENPLHEVEKDLVGGVYRKIRRRVIRIGKVEDYLADRRAVEVSSRVVERPPLEVLRSRLEGKGAEEKAGGLIEEALKSVERLEIEENEEKESPFVHLFRAFLKWMSEKTGTPLPLYVALKEGEKEILPSVLVDFRINPFSFDYYKLTSRLVKGAPVEEFREKERKKAEEKGKETQKDFERMLKSYVERKNCPVLAVKKVGKGKAKVKVKSLSKVAEEFFEKFLERGNLLNLKAAGTAALFAGTLKGRLLAYVKEIFSLSEDELAQFFLTTRRDAERELERKALEFKESYFPGLEEEPQIPAHLFDSLPFKEPEKESTNFFTLFLNSIDREKIPKELKEYLELLEENHEAEEFLYPFNLIT